MKLKEVFHYFEIFFDLIRRKPVTFVLALIIINLAFKSYNISEASFWLDEALHVYHSQKPVKEIVKYSTENPNPPLYNVLLHFWIKIFGTSETGARYMSLILSVLTAIAIFLFGRKHVNIQAAVIGSLIFSVSDIHLYYSHEARVYSLVSLLTVLSFYFFLDLLKKPGKWNLVKFAAINSMVLYTHFIPVFIIPAQFIAALVYYSSNKKGFWYYILGNIATALSLLPWLFLFNYREGKVSSWLKPPDFNALRDLMIRYFNNSEIILYTFLGLVVLTIFYLVFRGIAGKKSPDTKILVVLILWGALPIMADIIVSNLVVPIFLPRYLLFTTSAFFLLFGYCISVYRLAPAFKVAFLIPVLLLFWANINFNPYKGENWRKVSSIVSAIKDNNTIIIGCASYQYTSFSYYYDRDAYNDYNHTLARLTSQNIHFTDGAGIFNDVDLRHASNVLLILSHADIKDPEGKLLKHISGKMNLQRLYNVDGVKVYHFSRFAKEKQNKFYVDFEVGENSLAPKGVVPSEFAFSGNYISYIDTTLEFSGGFETLLSNTTYALSENIRISAQISPKKIGEETFLVCSVDDESGKQIFWRGFPLSHGLMPDHWNKVEMQVSLPEKLSAGDIIKVYLWNSKWESEALIDDIHVSFGSDSNDSVGLQHANPL